MVIIIYEDRERPVTPYTMPSIDEALDRFFGEGSRPLYRQSDEEELLSRDDARTIFEVDGQIVCYDEDGDKLTISRDYAA